jgi:hypothetical protein
MNPDLDFITEEDTFSEYGQRKQEPMRYLYREPITVDMEDILSVHEDGDSDNYLRGLLASSRRKSTRERMYRNDNAPNDNYSLKSSLGSSDIPLHDKFLQALKNNQQNVSGKLRFAYLTDELAMQRGMDLYVLKGLRRIKDKLEQIYQNGGGNICNLKKAILTGKGNAHDYHVTFTDSVSSYDKYASEYSIWNTLYRAAGSSPISAEDLVTVVASTLQQIVGLFPRDTEAETRFQRKFDLTELGDSVRDYFSRETPDGSASHDLGELYIPKSLVTDPEQRSPIQKATDWISDNPGKCLLIAAALIGGGIFIKRSLDRKTPALREVNRPPVGLSGGRPDTRKAPSKKVKFEELV